MTLNEWRKTIIAEYGEQDGQKVLDGIDELVSELWRRSTPMERTPKT